MLHKFVDLELRKFQKYLPRLNLLVNFLLRAIENSLKQIFYKSFEKFTVPFAPLTALLKSAFGGM